MILVTGAAGFIGSHLVKALGASNCWQHDPASEGSQKPLEYLFRKEWESIFHLGAISDTTCEDERALEETNVFLPQKLAEFCDFKNIPFIYASSASVHGNGSGPLNAYARSKAEFDSLMLQIDHRNPWYGLRFFNVYGPGEDHKGKQASLISQWLEKNRKREIADVFEPDTKRDFVYVDDVVSVMLHMWKARPASGIYDVGTGNARAIHEAVSLTSVDYRFIPFPDSLKGRYQFHTQADLTKLRAAGYTKPFLSLEDGIARMTK